MKTPALVAGFVVGLCLAVVSSCGGDKCSPTTCPTGCCNSSGLCESGSSTSACGAKGAACVACGVTASCVSGACMQNIGGSTGGGSAGTGGGSASAGGTSGGGSAGTGGGSASAGGTAGTGGGTASSEATAFCTQLGSRMTAFFSGRSSCSNGTITLTPSSSMYSQCLAGYGACNASDTQILTMVSSCIAETPRCTTGNENAAITGISQCFALLSDVSQSCKSGIGLGAP